MFEEKVSDHSDVLQFPSDLIFNSKSVVKSSIDFYLVTAIVGKKFRYAQFFLGH